MIVQTKNTGSPGDPDTWETELPSKDIADYLSVGAEYFTVRLTEVAVNRLESVRRNLKSGDPTGFILASDLSRGELALLFEVMEEISAWEDIAEGATIEKGALLTYAEDALYRCITEHEKQATWAPPTAVSLFVSETPPGVIPAWSQPAGSHDAYGMGFIVEHNGSFWESTNAANVWEPPTEWTEIDDPTA